jgi:hypothetical protein
MPSGCGETAFEGVGVGAGGGHPPLPGIHGTDVRHLLTFGSNFIETGTESYRPSHTRASRQRRAQDDLRLHTDYPPSR